MNRTILNKEISPIGLGCMNLSWAYGTPPDDKQKVRLLNEALDLGYQHLDTANIYGQGANEELLRDAVMHRRPEFLLATKTGIIVDGPRRGIDCSPTAILDSLDQSLKRLGTDYIDLFYLHRFDHSTPIADSIGAMSQAIEAGKILGYGVSEWNAEHIREAHAIHPMSAVQTEYSLWTRNPELGVLAATKELGVALVAFSPIARGALGGKLRDPTTLEVNDLRRSHPRFNAENWSKNLLLINKFDEIAMREGLTSAQLALGWVLAQGTHIHAIPGTTDLDHLRSNAEISGASIDTSVLEKVDQLINQGTVHGHRYPVVMRATIDTEDYS